MTDINTVYLSLSDIEKMESRSRASLINSLSGFKSANLLGTKAANGQTNLSIISSAFHLGSSPALMGLIIRPDVSPRHSLDNMRETKFFTLNHINEGIYKQAHQTSARYPSDISEFSACNLTEDYLDSFHAPYVLEANIKFGLEMLREIKIEENGVEFIIARVVSLYYPKTAKIHEGPLDLVSAKTVAISGLDTYHLTEKLSRLSYAKVDKEPSEI